MYRSYPFKFINQFLTEYTLGDYFKRYQIVKTVIIFILFGILLSVTRLAARLELFNMDIGPTYLYFVVNFWLSNFILLIIISVIYFAINTNAFRGQFRDQIQFKNRPKKLDPEIERSFKKINLLFSSLLFLFSTFIAIPIMQLTNTQFVTILAPMLGIIVSMIIRLILRKKTPSNKNEISLSKYDYKGISYNSGSIGSPSIQTERELNYYRFLASPSPYNDNIKQYLRGDGEGNFKGFENIFVNLTNILNENYDFDKNSISIHERTTDSIHFIINKLKNKYNDKVSIIFSDSDYPSIKSIFEKEFSITNSCKISQHSKHMSGDYSEEYFISQIESNIKKMNKRNKRIIVFLSHISFKSGLIFNISNIIKTIKEKFSKKIIFIVDGAQAVGNIQIDSEIFELTHFYVFCGHKWLLSTPTIGFLYFNAKEIKKNIDIDPVEFGFTNRSFDNFSYDLNEYKGTINLEPYISIEMSLSDMSNETINTIEKHNTYLAKEFAKSLLNIIHKAKVLSAKQIGGLTTIQIENAESLNKYLLQKQNNFSGFHIETDYNLIRFSFHYYMSIKDVNSLIYSILEFQNKSKDDTSRWF